MSRVCEYAPCDNVIPDTARSVQRFCSAQHRDRERENRRSGILPPDTQLVYENYKEPLRKVEKGFGYMGVMAMNSERTHVQCHECGYFFKAMNGHVKTHGLSVEEYKAKYQLMKKTALIGDKLREKRIEIYKNLPEAHKAGVKKMMEKHNAQVRSGKFKKNYSTPKWSLEKRNIEGLCPDQLLEKITDLAEEIGHTPTAAEFRKRHTRYASAIISMFGTWNKAVEMAKLLPNEMNPQKYTTIQLLEWLRMFYEENNRVPVQSDFARGYLPGQTVYINRFGNLNYARMEAGIPILVPLGGRRFVETMDYQNNYKPKELAIAR